jgi:hypothetical protein
LAAEGFEGALELVSQILKHGFPKNLSKDKCIAKVTLDRITVFPGTLGVGMQISVVLINAGNR